MNIKNQSLEQYPFLKRCFEFKKKSQQIEEFKVEGLEEQDHKVNVSPVMSSVSSLGDLPAQNDKFESESLNRDNQELIENNQAVANFNGSVGQQNNVIRMHIFDEISRNNRLDNKKHSHHNYGNLTEN